MKKSNKKRKIYKKKYQVKKSDEKKRLAGTEIPCFAIENDLLFVDKGIATAEYSNTLDYFTYRAKIAYRRQSRAGNMVFDVIFADSENKAIVVYKQILFHPENSFQSFKPDEDYYLKINLYDFGEDPILYQKKFAKIILSPVIQ